MSGIEITQVVVFLALISATTILGGVAGIIVRKRGRKDATFYHVLIAQIILMIITLIGLGILSHPLLGQYLKSMLAVVAIEIGGLLVSQNFYGGIAGGIIGLIMVSIFVGNSLV